MDEANADAVDHEEPNAESENFTVTVRVRPLNARELEAGSQESRAESWSGAGRRESGVESRERRGREHTGIEPGAGVRRPLIQAVSTN